MHITDAIILRKEELGEADLLITALTERFVNIRLVAQGARKVEAKLKGHLEPLSLSRLSFVAGRNNYRLVGAELLNFFANIKNDPLRLAMASEISRALDSALFEDRREENENFFALATEALYLLNDQSRSSSEREAALVWFRVRFLDELGLFSEEGEGRFSLPAESATIRRTLCADFVRAEPAKVRQFSEAASCLFNMYLAR